MTSAKAESKKHVLFDDSPVIGTGLCRAWLKSRFRYCTSHVPNLIPILGQLKLLNSTLVLNVEFNSVDFNKLFLSKGKIYLLYSHTRSVRNLEILHLQLKHLKISLFMYFMPLHASHLEEKITCAKA